MFKNMLVSSWRNLIRHKTQTGLNIAGLSIGVFVCLLIGTWLQRELSFDHFHPNAKEIFRLSNTFKSQSESFSQAPSGPAFGAQMPGLLPEIKTSCRLFGQGYKLQKDDKLFMENNALAVDSNFFEFFGFRLLKGDPSKVLQAPDQIVLTEKLAKKYFGSRNPIGETILVDGNTPMTVSGISENPPVNSHIKFDLVTPASQLIKQLKERYDFDMNNLWVGGWPQTYFQLEHPENWKKTEVRINEIAAEKSKKEWEENKMSYHYFLQPIESIHLHSNLRYDADNNGSVGRVKVFSVVGLIVLILACINYINLTTAGAMKRARETSIRKVVGAGKWALLRLFLIETFCICLVSVIIGVFLLKVILPAFSTWIGQPYTFSLTALNLLFLLSFVVALALASGIYPATVIASFNPVYALKGNLAQRISGNFLRKSLVVFQFTISIGLLASLLIINRQMKFIHVSSLGFNGNAVLEVNYFGEEKVNSKYNFIRQQLLSNPHFLQISRHSQNLVGGLGNGWTTTEDVKGKEISTSLYGFSVDTSYMDTYHLKLAAGRFFSPDYPTDTAKSVLVNEAAVRTFGWKNPENAIGKRFGKGENTRYVIGVVKDFNFESLHKPVEAILISYARRGNRLSIKLDGKDLEGSIDYLKKTWTSAFPEIPLQFAFVDDTLEKQYGSEQKMRGLFYGFAGLSLLIACLGLLGLSIFVIERKVKEIGIRKVLGSSATRIVGLLSGDFLKLVILSALLAVPLTWFLMEKWLEDFAYRIQIGWTVFLYAGLLATGIAFLTIGIKSLKAALANPVISLRTE